MIRNDESRMRFFESVWLRHGVWLAVMFGLVGGLHGAMPYFFDGDTGYHLAVARLTAEHGILQAFPWTPFSWMADHYADKEPVFHWLLVPLAGLAPALAAGIAGTVFGTGVLATLYVLLVKERVPDAGWWTVLSLAASSAFIYRLALVRPHLLSIALALVISWSAARKRWLVLAVACFLFPLCYTAWHLPVVLIVIVEAARWISTRQIEWRAGLIALAALAAGIAIHPNFPANLELFWIQNVTVLIDTVWADRAGFDMGREFEAFNLVSLVLYALLPTALMAAGAVFAWRKRHEDVLPVALAAIGVGFFIVTLRTQRFIEYLVPFAVFALAVVWRPPAHRRVAPFLVATGAIWIGLVARYPFELLFKREDAFPPAVAAELRAIVPEGEQIVTCDWAFTGEMMLALPERKFMVALDPVFFAMKDEGLYQLWFETIHEPLPNAASVLRQKFAAGFVMCQNIRRWTPLIKTLDADSQATFRGVHGKWIVFELPAQRVRP
jgi:hypothetical protein